MDGFVGVTAIDTRVAAVTVRFAGGLVIPPSAAVIFVEPVPAAVASPVLLMLAIAVDAELHVAVLVKLAVLESV
jgi:hypothetical protein